MLLENVRPHYLYHATSLNYGIKIIKDMMIKGMSVANPPKLQISFTRDPDLWYNSNQYGNANITFVFDYLEIKRRFKTKPFNFFDPKNPHMKEVDITGLSPRTSNVVKLEPDEEEWFDDVKFKPHYNKIESEEVVIAKKIPLAIYLKEIWITSDTQTILQDPELNKHYKLGDEFIFNLDALKDLGVKIKIRDHFKSKPKFVPKTKDQMDIADELPF